MRLRKRGKENVDDGMLLSGSTGSMKHLRIPHDALHSTERTGSKAPAFQLRTPYGEGLSGAPKKPIIQMDSVWRRP
jgi:hypothetical protein